MFSLHRYTNITKTNASGVHSVEIGNFNMTNLMPNSPYKVSGRTRLSPLEAEPFLTKEVGTLRIESVMRIETAVLEG